MKRIFHLNIIPPTLMLALSSGISALLGVFRDHLLASTFGATAGEGIYNLDTYYAAFRIPDLMYKLLIFGTISAAFIPIFTQYKKKGDMDNAWAFSSSMLHLVFIGAVILSAIAYVLAPQLLQLIVPGFEAEQLALTVKLMRILLLSPIIFSISSTLISLQDSFKCFFFRSLGPILYNAGIIIGIIYFAENFGVVGVVWGVLIGAILQLIFQLPAFWQIGYKHKWILGWRRLDVRKALKLLGPRLLGLSLYQVNILVATFIASFLMTGAITIFYLAENVQMLPLSVISISFAITSFATLSELATEEDKSLFANEIKRVLHQILFLIIPATVGLILLRDEVINVIFLAGKFSLEDAAITSEVLKYLLLSLFSVSLLPILSRGFYAYHNTTKPVISGAIGVLVTVLSSLLFTFQFKWGVAGLGLAFSLGSFFNWLVLHHLIKRHLGHEIMNWWNIGKMVIASAVMSLVVMQFQRMVVFEGSVTYKIMLVLAMSAVGAIVYFLVSHILKMPESKLFWGQVRRLK